jgi:hypothetical protein
MSVVVPPLILELAEKCTVEICKAIVENALKNISLGKVPVSRKFACKDTADAARPDVRMIRMSVETRPLTPST